VTLGSEEFFYKALDGKAIEAGDEPDHYTATRKVD
jgi:hypothetical protein